MYKATDVLIADHRKILKRINKLENLLTSIELENDSREEISSMVDFINVEINKHFLKEEKYFFPLLEVIPGMTEGPLKLIRYEHDEYWNISLKFQEMVDRFLFNKLNNEDQIKLKKTGLALIALLRVHIDKEDNVLFPMVEHYLDNNKLLETAEKIRFTDGPIEIKNNLIILDVRSSIKRKRQEVVIDTFNDIPPGKEIKIINNDRLNYLHQKLESKCRGRYAWRLEKEGPDKWVATVKKVA